MEIPEWAFVTHRVIEVLEALSIKYVIGGSIASILHGTTRSTLDADILAEIELHHIPDLKAALEAEFYIKPEMIKNAIRHRSSFNLLHQETMFKVDIFLPKKRIFDSAQLEHRVEKLLAPESDQKVWILSAEDIILAKLEWYNNGNRASERQWRDVLGVVKSKYPSLNTDYLSRMAAQLGITELMEAALAEGTNN